jgi:hypothetical protein
LASDVHQATISVAIMDSAGKLILESILETKAATILQFVLGLRGSLLVTFEEGTSAAWLYDLLKPQNDCHVLQGVADAELQMAGVLKRPFGASCVCFGYNSCCTSCESRSKHLFS